MYYMSFKKNVFRYYFPLIVLLYSGCNKTKQFTEVPGGIIHEANGIQTRVIVYSPEVIRVTRNNENNFSKNNSLSVIAEPEENIDYKVTRENEGTVICTQKLKVSINKKGLINYSTIDSEPILSEEAYFINDTTDNFENPCKNMQVGYRLSSEEGIYGLGQFQHDYMNYRGKSLEMVQTNQVIAVLFLLSTKSYGLLFDNYSFQIVNNKDHLDILEWWCEDGDAMDYYFISGENPDKVISGYRYLTGNAPMYGKWAYGYWQSKERYTDRDDLLSTALKFRKYKFPADNIVQDWRYWGDYGWSALLFDETIFPGPKQMIDILHENNFHVMISVWSVFGEKSPIYKEMGKNNLLFKTEGWSDCKFYDPFSPSGRQIYWKHLNKGLFINGIDAWWMDGTEPEFKPVYTAREMRDAIVENGNTALGPWTKYLNAFSLMTVKAAYEGQRGVTRDKRVFILTRSAYAGQQRYAGAAWSGDISARFDVLKAQISAGINYCMAGLPYWTTDIGAFHSRSLYLEGSKDNAYRELYVRWFQYGAFCPLFRSHGTDTPREPWQFGEPGSWAYDVLLKFTNLRYRLLPYIYSLAWKVTNEQYTIMRGLPMAFPNDSNTYSIGDSYMFGNEFLVSPVVDNFYYRSSVEGQVIPSTNLKTDDQQNAGLSAVYFDGVNFDKEVNRTIDKQLDISWAGAPPVGCRRDSFSIRWTGYLFTGETGDYKFILRYRKGVRLWINDELIIDHWNSPHTGLGQGNIWLESGRLYPVKVEYYSDSGWPFINLSWETPSLRDAGKSQLAKEKTKDVYLPRGDHWIDFWTGESFDGGQWTKAKATIDVMPLFVRAGSIIPMGPYVQYADEKPEAPLEIRIYPGADGTFTLYEDEGDNYNYEKGVYSTIRFDWDDSGRILTIHKREGKYPGMIVERTFKVMLVSVVKGIGGEPVGKPDATLNYTGEKVTVKL